MYDIIYIGGGLNYAGAIIAAKKGLKVALVEKDLSQLGGVCLHKGCIPSKMFLHYAQSFEQSKSEIFEGEINFNIQKLVEKKDRLINAATKAVHSQCKGIDLIEGEGVVKEAYKVSVKDEVYEAKHIVIGTGSSPFIPEGITYDAKRVITSDEVLELDHFPTEICIYGAGAIGLEMASFFCFSGVKVTVLLHSKGLLKKANPLIQKALKKELEDRGIQFLEDHKIVDTKVSAKGVAISFENADQIDTPMLLVASGRKPNLSVVQTDEIKVQRGIDTDEYFQSSLKDHYAVGDCNAKLQLAHAARAEVLNVTMSILGKSPKALNLNHVVQFIHTLPMSYASVGQNKDMLEKSNTSYKQSQVSLREFSASSFHNAKNGLMFVYADEEGFILGAEILAPDAEELIAPVAMALVGEMDANLAGSTIMAHPSFAEALERSYFRL